MKNNKWFANLGSNVIIKYRYLFIIGLIALMYFCFLGVQKVVVDNTYKAMLEKDNPLSLKNDHFQDIFGNNDYIYVLIEAEDVVNHDVLSYIRTLSEDLEANLPFVKDIKALTSVEYVSAKDDALNANDLIEEVIPESDSVLSDLRKKILSKQVYQGRLIDDSCKQTGIFIRFNSFAEDVYVPKSMGASGQKGSYLTGDIIYADEYKALSDTQKHNYTKVKDPRMLVSPAYDYIVGRNNCSFCTVTATGLPIISYNVFTVLQKETGRSFMLTLVIAIVILTLLYRSFRATVGPILIVLFSILITFGIIGWLQIVVSTFALIVALLLIVISIGYSIHVINYFRSAYNEHGNRYKAVINIFEHTGWPIFVTALTTVVGFVAFSFVNMVPVRNLGITCAIGVIATFILVIVYLPIVFSFGKDKKPATLKSAQKNEAWFRFADLPLNNFRLTILAILLLVIGSVGGSFYIYADTDFINLFGDKNKFVKDARHTTENLGSLYSYEVLIELPNDGMVKEPSVLNSLAELDELINSFETTKFTVSILEIVKDINQTLHNSDTTYFRIPKTKGEVAQFLLFYEMGGGEELENVTDYEYQKLRTSVRINRSTTDLRFDFDKIESFCKSAFPQGTKVSIVGDMSIFLRAVSYLVDGQIMSIIIAFVLITIIMSFVLKSFKVGLVTMIPNVLPVFTVMGIMGLFDISLNLQTIVAAPVIMGLAVDDTVHYFIALKNEFLKYGSYKTATRYTFVHVGKAITNTSIILVIGFASFFFTKVNSLSQISVLLISGVVVALLADLFLTPALLALMKPFGKEKSDVHKKIAA